MLMRSTNSFRPTRGWAVLLALTVWATGAVAGENDMVTAMIKGDDGAATLPVNGIIANDAYFQLAMRVGRQAQRREYPRDKVESVEYNVLGDTYREAADQFDPNKGNNPEQCLQLLADLEKEMGELRIGNPELPRQYLLFLRARAQHALANDATDPRQRTTLMREAAKTLDTLFKEHRDTVFFFEARLLQQQILTATDPTTAAARWTILVNDLTDAVKKAPWGGRYLLGARLHQIGAELDPLLKATGNEARVREQFAKIDAVQKEPQWKELATASEQSDAVRMRLRIHAYLKDKAQLQTELGNAIRQAQLESAVNDLRVYYLMRADSGYEALKALKADTPEAQTLATQTFMDYLRIHMLYAEQAGDHTPVVALRLAELYHRIKGPDWYERAQELAEEARKAPATRAQAEQLLTQIRADAPADAKDAAPGAK